MVAGKEVTLTMCGLDPTIKPLHAIGHHFFDATFEHYTSLCIAIADDGAITVKTRDDSLLMLAWGNGPIWTL